MRRANARPNNSQSTYFTSAFVPQQVIDVLNTAPIDRKDACRIGADAAIAFVEVLYATPHFAGFGLLPAIAQHLEENCPPAVAIGFFAQVDRLLLRGFRADAVSVRALIRSASPVAQTVKEAHDPRRKA